MENKFFRPVESLPFGLGVYLWPSGNGYSGLGQIKNSQPKGKTDSTWPSDSCFPSTEIFPFFHPDVVFLLKRKEKENAGVEKAKDWVLGHESPSGGLTSTLKIPSFWLFQNNIYQERNSRLRQRMNFPWLMLRPAEGPQKV